MARPNFFILVQDSANCNTLKTMRLVLATLSACLVAQAQIPAQDVRNTYVPNTDTHFTRQDL